MLYARAVIVEFMGVDAFISISRPRGRSAESVKSYQYLSLCASLSREARPCALEAVLMVCIIHIGEPNRNSTYDAISFPDVRPEISGDLKKNSLPSYGAMEKLLSYRNAISRISYVYQRISTLIINHSRVQPPSDIFPRREVSRKFR